MCPRQRKSNTFMSPVEDAPLEHKIHPDLTPRRGASRCWLTLLSYEQVCVCVHGGAAWVYRGALCASPDLQGLQPPSISALQPDLQALLQRCFPCAVKDFLVPLLSPLPSITVLQKLEGPATPDGAAAARLQHHLHPEGQQEEEARAENHPAGHRPARPRRPEQGAGRAVAEGNWLLLLFLSQFPSQTSS